MRAASRHPKGRLQLRPFSYLDGGGLSWPRTILALYLPYVAKKSRFRWVWTAVDPPALQRQQSAQSHVRAVNVPRACPCPSAALPPLPPHPPPPPLFLSPHHPPFISPVPPFQAFLHPGYFLPPSFSRPKSFRSAFSHNIEKRVRITYVARACLRARDCV